MLDSAVLRFRLFQPPSGWPTADEDGERTDGDASLENGPRTPASHFLTLAKKTQPPASQFLSLRNWCLDFFPHMIVDRVNEE
jgi:hypothetical protein